MRLYEAFQKKAILIHPKKEKKKKKWFPLAQLFTHFCRLSRVK